MLKVDSIENGLVLDHITPGRSMDIYDALGLDKLTCSIAIIKNARSGKTDRKDMIKLENCDAIDLDVLGLIDPKITVNVIENGQISQKKKLQLPARVSHVVRCKNPRCITSTEQDLEHIFVLTNPEKAQYRCFYCEQEYKNERG